MNSCVGDLFAFAPAVLRRQVLHREVNALQLAAGHRQIARLRRRRPRARCASNCALSSSTGTSAPTFDVGAELDPGLFHQLQPPIEELAFRA